MTCSPTASGRRSDRAIADGRADAWKSESCSGREPEERKPSTGWYVGGEGFRGWLLDGIEKALADKSNSYRSSEQAHEHGEKRARGLLEAFCRFFGWEEVDLSDLKGGDVRRLLLAELIRDRTSVNQRWMTIAEVRSLPLREKLQILEGIWEDLSSLHPGLMTVAPMGR